MPVDTAITRNAPRLRRAAHALGLAIGARVTAPLVALAHWIRPPRPKPAVSSPPYRRIEVAPDFDADQYGHLAEQLQARAHGDGGPASKLLDLRARSVQPDLFRYLAMTWPAAPAEIPRLAILLDYEPWALLRLGAERALRPLVDRGIGVQLFYSQQEPEIAAWFADGTVRHHNLAAVVAWLQTDWRRMAPSNWTKVLDATSVLVQSSAEDKDVADLLVALADLALSFDGSAAAEHASKHARSALHLAGITPSVARCRALRSSATAQLRLGEARTAIVYLDGAIRDAILLGNRVEEASALAEAAGHWLRHNHLARAETQLRSAYALVSPVAPTALRARIHRDLAETLHQQGVNNAETESHAAAALALYGSDASLAADASALLDRIRVRRGDRATDLGSPGGPGDPGGPVVRFR